MELVVEPVICLSCCKCICIFPHGFSHYRQLYTSRNLFQVKESTGSGETGTEKCEITFEYILPSFWCEFIHGHVCIYSRRGGSHFCLQTPATLIPTLISSSGAEKYPKHPAYSKWQLTASFSLPKLSFDYSFKEHTEEKLNLHLRYIASVVNV